MCNRYECEGDLQAIVEKYNARLVGLEKKPGHSEVPCPRTDSMRTGEERAAPDAVRILHSDWVACSSTTKEWRLELGILVPDSFSSDPLIDSCTWQHRCGACSCTGVALSSNGDMCA